LIETPDTNKETAHQNQNADSAPTPNTDSKGAEQADDDLDFVVTEAHDQTTELVGGFQGTKTDDLGIETPADLMEAEASHDVGEHHQPDPGVLSPLGDSTPPPPPPADKPLDSDPSPAATDDPATSQIPTSTSGLQKLSNERLQEISQQMQGGTPSDNYLSNEEKHQLLRSIEDGPASQVESSPPLVKT